MTYYGGGQTDSELIAALLGADVAALPALLADLPQHVIDRALELTLEGGGAAGRAPQTPMEQALELDPGYRVRPHLELLSERISRAVEDVEAGRSRRLIVSMPPRSGKSHLVSQNLPVWLLRRHPDWKIGLISHDQSLATLWGRQVRRTLEEHRDRLGVELARDAGAASEWQTTAGGGITSRSVGQSVTGRGFQVLLIDDAVKDYAAAHSAVQREALWEWWTANAVTRLEPPSLVVVVGTRWHADDLLGRLLSRDHDGDPDAWEAITLPALAEAGDALGREPGEPLLSPLVPDETPDQALDRWRELRTSVGSYAWAALYQQRPAPAEGAVFDASWWRFWTADPERAARSPGTRLVRPGELAGARLLDSWDLTFGGEGDYVVGQRWARLGADRFLIAQKRGRWSFTETLAELRGWTGVDDRPLGDGDTRWHLDPSPAGHLVHERLVEAAANGAAAIDVLRREVAGVKPIKPRGSKEARARAVTPEIESGNVYLPHPGDPGNEWVGDLLAELRDFPHGAHDDQVDALTQALSALRDAGQGGVTVPGRLATVSGGLGRAGGSSPTSRGPGFGGRTIGR